MPTHRKNNAPQHTHLAIRIDGHDVRICSGININLYGSMRYWIDENEPVYTFETLLTLHGTCTYPGDRAGAPYEITLIGDQSMPHHLSLKIKDLHERDKNNVPRYRTYRGGTFPVYAEPSGLTVLDKIRGESRWTLWMFVTPQMIADSLLLLSFKNPVFIAVHEKKVGRQRHVQNLTLQTTDPAED